MIDWLIDLIPMDKANQSFQNRCILRYQSFIHLLSFLPMPAFLIQHYEIHTIAWYTHSILLSTRPPSSYVTNSNKMCPNFTLFYSFVSSSLIIYSLLLLMIHTSHSYIYDDIFGLLSYLIHLLKYPYRHLSLWLG